MNWYYNIKQECDLTSDVGSDGIETDMNYVISNVEKEEIIIGDGAVCYGMADGGGIR